jgi:hypothetical protein
VPTGAAGAGGAGARTGSSTTGAAGGIGAAGSTGTLVAAGAGAAFLAAGFSAGFASGNASRNRRATGASTVLEALFTYSPISVSFASASLLVIPSSLASADTRVLPGT